MTPMENLTQIMQRLTAPDGCPWDRVQTHTSIRQNMIEEAYEAVDAIDSGNKAAMIEELGDLLLQVVLHADIAKRSGDFALDDIIERLCTKLVGRHTHIFGTQAAANPDEAINNWEKAKAKEKSYTSVAQQLQCLPKGLPSLLRAQKIIKKSGFKTNLAKLVDLGENLNKDNAGEFLFCAASLALQAAAEPEIELNSFNGVFVDQMSNDA